MLSIGGGIVELNPSNGNVSRLLLLVVSVFSLIVALMFSFLFFHSYSCALSL